MKIGVVSDLHLNWICGHSHQRKQLQIGECLCMMNAFGYAGSETQQYEELIFKI